MMRTLVHLSDLHFGRIDHATVRPLAEFVNKRGPTWLPSPAT